VSERIQRWSLNRSAERRGVDELREWWELIFFCWRWLVILIPATAQAVAVVVAIIDGRPPPLLLDGLR
jgi:hypothetical protein